MSADASATLSANDAVCGPIYVNSRATYVVDVTGTITVTPQISHNQTNWAPYAAGLTADGGGVVWGPCWLRLIASGVTGGSAVCTMRKAF